MNPIKLPFYARITLILVGLIAFVYVIIVGQSILVPFVLSIVISILLNPVINLLMRWGFNRLLAITAVVLLMLVLGGLGGALFIGEMSSFRDSLPTLQMKFVALFDSFSDWISIYFKISRTDIDNYINKGQADMVARSGNILGNTFATVGGQLGTALLLPIYIFLILLYKPLLLEFLRRVFGATHSYKVNEVLEETKHIVQGYLNGLLIEAVLIGVMSTAGLLLLGIKYAVFFGILGALLNILPYIGLLIGAFFPVIMALIDKPHPVYALMVLALYVFIKVVDNIYIFPRIVASQVKINAMMSILAVLVGGAIWGVGGMFLAMPAIAILKVIFDRNTGLEPLGYLLGEGDEVKEKRKKRDK